MVNAWSLLHSEMNGTMDEDYPIMNQKDDDYYVSADRSQTGNFLAAESVDLDFNLNYADDVIFTGINTASSTAAPFWYSDGGAYDNYVGSLYGEDHISIRTDGYPGSIEAASAYPGHDTISFGESEWERIEKPQPNLKYKSQKYQEDKGIEDLKGYVSSTYQGHYTNDNSDVQTLDLIHSVGDAESFCRSNALKYLSRYDKKGQAKRDILKAMHYCLLLYYFSGNTQEPDTTDTRYETF